MKKFIDNLFSKKLNIKVGECMTVGVFTLEGSKSVVDAAKLLRKTQVGCVIVTKNKKAVGILTERDITYKVVANGKNPLKTPLSSIMSKPLRVIKASESVENAAMAIKENKIKRLPVVDAKGSLVGIVTEGDLLRVYPGIVDVMAENQLVGSAEEGLTVTGVCDVCGAPSEDLKKVGRKLVCEECREEDEV
ncbi:Inosine-5'-monophosphate dehydrogenase [Candidatus Anstonella stagnisolia]|nr:Inosine-5'-monophosphate dehydrogenase [Candidatus Anstonella stagnisolia]